MSIWQGLDTYMPATIHSKTDAGENPRVLVYVYSFFWRRQLKPSCDFKKQFAKLYRENATTYLERLSCSYQSSACHSGLIKTLWVVRNGNYQQESVTIDDNPEISPRGPAMLRQMQLMLSVSTPCSRSQAVGVHIATGL